MAAAPAKMAVEVVDADAHMIEPPSLFAELMTRFPDQIGIRSDTKLGVLVEGRPYPYYEGPGAGCPPQNGMTEAPGRSRQKTKAAGITDREGDARE